MTLCQDNGTLKRTIWRFTLKIGLGSLQSWIINKCNLSFIIVFWTYLQNMSNFCLALKFVFIYSESMIWLLELFQGPLMFLIGSGYHFSICGHTATDLSMCLHICFYENFIIQLFERNFVHLS